MAGSSLFVAADVASTFGADSTQDVEVRNIAFKFENGLTFSMAVGRGSYSSDREIDISEKPKTSVEVALYDDNGVWYTKSFWAYAYGTDPGDDVAGNVSVDEIPYLLMVAKTWEIS